MAGGTVKTPTEKESARFDALKTEHRKIREILARYEALSPANRRYVLDLLKADVEANPK
jgi:hypothetical protein